MIQLIDLSMHDGSRHFGSLPECFPFEELRDHLTKLPGTKVTSFVSDGVTEAWIHFKYQQHTFAGNTQLGEWWFFVDDPTCSDEVLWAVLNHCAKKLGRG